ncbi:MAG: 3-dehydroquinate synthase [Planctomycetes bacterium]|nr:3-dehydroquinate synthase [Planctomycetota bacterium]
MGTCDRPAARRPAGLDGRSYHQEFEVLCRYDVFFTDDLFDPASGLLPSVFADPGPDGRFHVGVCLDEGLVNAQPDLPNRIAAYFAAHEGRIKLAGEPAIVPGGEARKGDWEAMLDAVWHFGTPRFGRQDYAMIIGGGAMLDLVGFALSIVYRGGRQVRVPTTVLAQCDAGVEVRTFVNEAGRKDFASTLAPPFAVINDRAMLRSLGRREWIAGTAEAFKIALCADRELFDFLCGSAAAIGDRDEDVMDWIIQRSAVLHLERIRSEGMAFGTGREQPVDLGHWVGHRLEAMSRYWLPHGQAIAVGIAVDGACARRLHLISDEELDRILDGLTRAGLPIYHKHLDERTAHGQLKLLASLEDMRHRFGPHVTVLLPDRIGHAVPVRAPDRSTLAHAVAELAERAGDSAV